MKRYFWYNSYVNRALKDCIRCPVDVVFWFKKLNMDKPILLKSIPSFKGSGRSGIYLCKCGNKYTTKSYDVDSGKSTNCGCVRREKCKALQYKHGETKTPLYSRWASMHRRCRPIGKDKKHYFDKGITVCERWKDYINFKEDMYIGFSEKLTLDRIDNTKGYSPDNCRWVSWKQQQNNKSDNVIFNYRDSLYTMAELAKISIVGYSTINSRLRLNRNSKIKWTVEMAVETPALTTSERRKLY
jgi:hypothetical protein